MTIPANEIVNVVPSVLAPGGTGIDTIGLVLTNSNRVPIGSVSRFTSKAAVSSFFGPNSTEFRVAGGGTGYGEGYFGGFSGSDKLPSAILFAQYNEADVAAYLRGASVAALTLTQLQAISGTLIVTVDGVTLTAGALNLSAATSFSSAASIIQTALQAAAPAGASVTGSIGGIVTAKAGAKFTGTGSGTDLTVASITGVLHPGARLSGTGVPAGTYIVSQTSGTAGSNGVYVTNHATTSSGDALVATSNILDVTAVSSGTIQPTDVISGTGLTAGTAVQAQLTGSAGGIGTYTIDSFQQVDSTSVTSLSTVLNVTAVGSGTLEVGALLAGTAITSGSLIEAQITGSGGTGTYRVSKASTTISETITTTAVAPVVTYDSVSGAFVLTSGTVGATSSMSFATGTTSATLKLTAATGAVLSQGAAAAAPATFMDALVLVNSNWVSFFTTFDPDGGSGNSVKEAFASWNTAQNNRFAYICWDTDLTPTESVPATSSLGYLLEQAEDSGTCLIYDATDLNLAAFVAGAIASIDFTKTNGRITLAFKGQAGLVASVSDPTIALNLGGDPQTAGDRGNGYNFYGAYANANAAFTWFQRGFVTGDFAWLDSYIDQIWLNNAFQNSLLTLLREAKAIPYGDVGFTMIENSLQDPINAGLNFGAFGPGVLSASQIAQVNGAAGADIADTLQTQGYYLQIKPASATVRASRTSPDMTFWYIDQGSVQAMTLDSIALS